MKPKARTAFEALRATPLFAELIGSGRLIDSQPVENPGLVEVEDGDLVLEHPTLRLISFPYEWPFAMLQAAAVHHLDLQIDALEAGFVLIDASAYNVQFKADGPVFIDVSSLRPYREGEPWIAHHQFCESFLAPLVLQARLGIPYQAWYRGRLEGISVNEVAKLLHLRDCLSPTILAHLILPGIASRKGQALRARAIKNRSTGLSETRYRALLQQLRDFIATLVPKDSAESVWADYSDNNTYQAHETEAKLEAVAAFCRAQRPNFLIDIGCNDATFSACALRNGVEFAVGLDADQGALHQAYRRARTDELSFVPLFADLANPSPDQGFAGEERAALTTRLGTADAVLALAVAHHLIIGCNVPLERAVAWLVDRGKSGLIEFVPKQDPTIQTMLELREDIFPTYTRDAFLATLESQAEVVSSTVVSDSGREIFRFQKP